jgi:hypothetical protein
MFQLDGTRRGERVKRDMATLGSRRSITDDGYKRMGRSGLQRKGPLLEQEAVELRHK